MSDYKNVEQKLNSSGQAKLQDIVFRIIDNEYNHPLNLIYLGGAQNDDKTRWGTPDVFFQLSNGQYIFVEVTTQKNGIDKKIQDDLKKCKDEAETAKIKVNKVIYACLFKPIVKNISSYQEICREFCEDINPFDFWGLDKLTTLLTTNYRNLAIDELGVQFSYGSINTLAEYLKNKNFDVSQTHDFLYREQEVSEITCNLLENKIVLLYGKAGCGKTRLCIQVATQLKKQNNFKEIYFIKGAFSSAINDLQLISAGEKVIFILDDVNRMPYLKDFVQYTRTHKNIYILATVRDYAIGSIKKDLYQNALSAEVLFYNIEPLKTEYQEEIIKKILPNANYNVLKAIKNISNGNLRFAIMSAEIIKSGKPVPKGVKELMENHFELIDSDLNQIKTNNKEFKSALIIVALLHRVVILDFDEFRLEKFNSLLKGFGLERDKFIDAMNFWEQKEAIGISFDGKVIEVSDQILANYLFYRLVFEEKIVELSTVFETMFPAYRSCFVDMFQSILPVYGFKETVIEKELKKIWENFCSDKQKAVPFLETFNQLLPVESISFIRQNFGLSDSFIDILCGYEATQYDTIAIDLLLEAFESNYENSEIIISKIVENFNIHRNSFANNLHSQIYLLQKINEKLNRNLTIQELFYNLAEKLLDFTFHSTEMQGEMSMVLFKVEIVPSSFVFEMRSLIWKGLFTLLNTKYEVDKVLKILSRYRSMPNSRRAAQNYKLIFENDKKLLQEIIAEYDYSKLYFSNKVVIKIMLECCCSEQDDYFNEQITLLEKNDNVFKLYSILFSRKHVAKYQEEYFYKQYASALKQVNLPEDFFSFIKGLIQIKCDEYKINNAINYFFEYIIKNKSNKYLDYLHAYIAEFADYKLHPYKIIEYALKEVTLDNLTNIFHNSNLVNKNVWLLELFCKFKTEEVNEKTYFLCLETLRDEYIFNEQKATYQFNILYFLPFEEYKNGFVKTVFEMVNNVFENEFTLKYHLLEHCYNIAIVKSFNLTFDKISNMFGDNYKSLYYEMYFKLLKRKVLLSSGDFIKYLVQIDNDYLFQYFDIYCNMETDIGLRHYLKVNILKSLPNLSQNVLEIYKRALKNMKYIYPINEMEEIIKANFDDSTIEDFSKLFTKEYYNDEKNLSTMTRIMCSMKKEWQIIFVKVLISSHININIFKEIPIFSHPSMWSGNDSTMWEERLNMISELLNSMELISENLSYIEDLRGRKSKLEKYKEQARLRELAELRNFDS